MKKLFRESIQIIHENWMAYLWINILIYGAIIIGVIYGQQYPMAHLNAKSLVQNSFRSGFLSFIFDLCYVHRDIPLAILVIFATNLLLGALVQITIPSLLIPFFGFIVSLYRAFNWGLVFGLKIFSPMILGLNIIEGQAYIISTFGVYLLAVRFLHPSKYSLSSHKKGYLVGLKLLAKLYVLIICVLFFSACYEVAIISSNILFPNESHSSKQLGFSGANIKMDFSGSYIYYDSTTVNKNDAKVIGIMLEDVLYLKPDATNAVKICKTDSCYEIQLYLDERHWENSKIENVFLDIDNKLNTLNRQIYHVKAFSEDSSGRRKAKYY